MNQTHVHALYRHAEGPLHRLRPEVKLAATLFFVIAVVATPREAFWAFGAHAALVAAAAAAGRLPPGFLLRRLLIEVPFLLFAVFLPFVGRGERLEVIGLSLSREGLWAAWNILAKATLGAAASVILASTTRVPDILKGFARLRFPRVLTAMMGFMVRYLDVVIGDLGRMRVAQQSRAYQPRWFGQARALGALAGTLFVRSYERGERVYLAMQARGYRGEMPELEAAAAPAGQWLTAAAVVALAAAVAALGWVLR
ncbi:MAG: cobalt ECF transporter T component CbiQ [Acidimicrobiia bacterium]|nr:cobalt ECF transporter T component CbiQ [Acidimicrobiia bacterium]